MVELNLEIVEKIEKSEIRTWQKKADQQKKKVEITRPVTITHNKVFAVTPALRYRRYIHCMAKIELQLRYLAK